MDLTEVAKTFNDTPYKHPLYNFSVEDKRKYQVEYKRHSMLKIKFKGYPNEHPIMRDLDTLQRANDLDAKCMMYMRQALQRGVSLEDAYCYYLDRLKPLHPLIYQRRHQKSIRKGKCPPHVKEYDFSA